MKVRIMKKSLKDISWDVTEPEYRKDPSLSYSTIAKYNRGGFESLATLFDSISTPSLLFGSLVDCLATEPEEFEQKYMVVDMPQLSDSLASIADELVSNYSMVNRLDDIDEEVLAAIGARHDFWANDKYKATRVKKIKEGCEDYFQKSKRAEGRTLIPTELYKSAALCAERLKTDEHTSKYFVQEVFSENELLYQLKFKGEYEGIPVRCMMDAVYVDHENKKIIPVDLKTSSSPPYKFPDSYLKWNYFIQSGLYSYILKQNLEKDEYFKDFEVSPYHFVVISKNHPHPLIWEDVLNFYEGSIMVDGKEYSRPWREVVKELWSILQQDTLPVNPLWVKGVNDIYSHIE